MKAVRPVNRGLSCLKSAVMNTQSQSVRSRDELKAITGDLDERKVVGVLRQPKSTKLQADEPIDVCVSQ